MFRKLFCFSTTLLVALLLSVAVLAQTDRGTVTGTVSDSAAAAVPGASVTITNIATNAAYTAVTSAEGLYVVPALPPGTYKIRVEKSGFKVAEIAQLGMPAGNTVSANVALTVGQVSETVEVAVTLESFVLSLRKN